MAPKKVAPNAFFLFISEYIEAERRRGRNVSRETAAQEMDGVWKSMTKEERQPYTDQAAYAKKHPNGEVKKYTSDGRLVSLVLAGEKHKIDLKNAEREDIFNTVSRLAKEKELDSHYFHFIHTNYFCKTRQDGLYVPAEIAVLRFNLEYGEIASFHRIIQPNEVPPGYRYDMQDYAKEYHQIPFEETDLERYILAQPQTEREVNKGLTEFLAEFTENGKPPILYAHPENVEVAQKILDQFSMLDENVTSPTIFKVYDMHFLLYEMKNKIVGNDEKNNFPRETSALEEVRRDINCFASGISCDFHKEDEQSENKYQYCSLSIVRRLMYLLCDHTCHFLGIELVPGQHCHARIDTAGSTAQNLSRASSQATSALPSRYASAMPSAYSSAMPSAHSSVRPSAYSSARPSAYASAMASGYTSRDPYADEDGDSQSGFQPVVNRRAGTGRGRGVRLQ